MPKNDFFCKSGHPARHHRTMAQPGRTISSDVISGREEELSALPIWTITLGIFALLTFGLTALPSIVCGHLALARNRNSGSRSLAKSVTVAGLVIGYIGVAVLGGWITIGARHLFQ